MEVLLMLIGALGVFFFLLFIVFYVLKSIGLATMAANKGIDLPWLAWIPVADLYIAGKIVGEMEIFGFRIPNLALWTPVIFCGSSVLYPIPVFGWIAAIAVLVFGIGFTYKLFEMYTEHATLFTILSIFLCLWPVFVFVIRNNKPRDSFINI